MASLSHVTAMFQHPILTTLTDVNFNSLTILQRELNANASSITSNRGTGTHGHLVLACRPAVFAIISPIAFNPPPNPGVPPAAAGVPAATRTLALAEHKTQLDEFNLFTFVDHALRQQLIKAIPAIHIKALEDPTLGYSNISTLTMMTHLWDNYGTINADELQHNAVALNSPTWNLSSPIESLFARIQDHADFATAGGAPIPDTLLAQAAYSNIEATGLYPTYCDGWRSKQPIDRTWANFKTYFTTAYKDLHRHTTSSAGYHSAHVAKPADTMSQLRSDMTELIRAELLAFKLDLAAANAPPPQRKEKFYCHTHGISTNKNHTSQTCNNKGPNHQDAATIRNKMGGSTRENDYRKPRT